MKNNYLPTWQLLRKVTATFLITFIALATVKAQSPCGLQKIVLSSSTVPENARGEYTPAGTYNGAPQWTHPGTAEGELFTIRWTGSLWEIVYNFYGQFTTNSDGSKTNLPCTGWTDDGFGQITLSGGCGSLLNLDQPTEYTVTGGGSYCTGSNGVAIGLSGSESGVTYQLKLDNTNSGTAVEGTDSAISFGNQTSAGTYTVEATRTSGGCSLTMAGNATINVNTSPTVTINPSATTITGGDTFSLTASGASSYTWNTGANTTVLTGAPSSPTTYSVSGTDNNGCIGQASATVSVTCNPAIVAKATSVTQTAVLGPGNCSVALKGTGFGTGYTFTGPGGYIFSAVYRRAGSYTINGLNVTQPGTYTLKISYKNACGESSSETMTYVVTGTACQ